MRLGRVPRVAAEPEQLPRLHPIADLDADAVLLEVGEEDVLAVADVDEHVVAGGIGGVHRTGQRLVVGEAVDRGHHLTPGRRHDPLPPRPVVGVRRARASVGAAVAPHGQVVGVALIGDAHVVVEAGRVAPPEDEPLAFHGQAQGGLGAVSGLGVGGQGVEGPGVAPDDRPLGVEDQAERPAAVADLVLGRVRPEVGPLDQLTLLGAVADATGPAQLGHHLLQLLGRELGRQLGAEPGRHRAGVTRRQLGDDLPTESTHVPPGRGIGLPCGRGRAGTAAVATVGPAPGGQHHPDDDQDELAPAPSTRTHRYSAMNSSSSSRATSSWYCTGGDFMK